MLFFDSFVKRGASSATRQESLVHIEEQFQSVHPTKRDKDQFMAAIGSYYSTNCSMNIVISFISFIFCMFRNL